MTSSRTANRGRAATALVGREVLAIVAVYTAAWFLLLLATGRYWDDWAALDVSARATVEWSRQQGQFWQWHLLRLLSSLPGTERLGHILAFAGYLISAVALHRILLRLPGLDSTARIAIPALFAVFPVNAARYAHIDLMYAISLAVFMVGWWLVAADLDEPRLWRRLAAGAALMFSMLSTGSLLMFLFVVPAYVMWARSAELRDGQGRRALAARYGFLWVLPVAAWAIRTTVLAPSGLYEDYNEVTLESAEAGLEMLPEAVDASIVQPIIAAFSSQLLAGLVVGVVLYALALKLRLTEDGGQAPSLTRQLALLGAALGALFLGLFPYLAVEKLPQAAGVWDSRHQLLIPVGAALLVYASVSLMTRALRLNERVGVLAMCILLGVFISANVRTSLDFQADWYKQVSLMQRMAESDDMRSGGHFVFTDRASELNVAGRAYRFYEYNGIMRKVFGDTSRFGVDESQEGWFDPLTWVDYEQYNCWEYDPDSPRYRVTITRGSLDVTNLRVLLGLMRRELVSPERFRDVVIDVVKIETRPESVRLNDE